MPQDPMEKRRIIVSEILHWRSSRLLPEQYCDFLLNLYRDQPDDEAETADSHKGQMIGKSSAMRWSLKQWLLGCLVVALLLFVVLHFKGFPIVMQILTGIVIVACFYVIGAKLRTKQPSIALLFVGLGSLLMLALGFLLLRWHEVDTELHIFALLLGASLIWLIIGISLKIPLLHFCGWVGCLLLYGAFLTKKMPLAEWYEIELFWLPLCGVLLWLSWYVSHRNKQSSPVLFVIGVLLWIAPELQAYLFYKDLISIGLIELVLFVKIVMAALILFVFRKKWMVWIV